MRARLPQLGPEEHVLLVVMHHIACDGWSMGIFARELGALYEAAREKRDAALPELAIQYADFAQWQREALSGGELARQLAYWKELLADMAPSLELPTDRPRPAVRRGRGARRTFNLPASVSEGVKALSRSEGATPFMTLLAAFDLLLAQYSRQRDVVVGSPTAGRTRPEIEGLIGFFVNTLVLRVAVVPEESFRELLARVRETCLGAFAHQDLPFEHLVDALHPERDLGRTPLFQVSFALQNAPSSPLAMQGTRSSALDVDAGVAKFDLSLVLYEDRDGISGTWEYSTDLFDPATVEQMAAHYQRVLEEVVSIRRGAWMRCRSSRTQSDGGSPRGAEGERGTPGRSASRNGSRSRRRERRTASRSCSKARVSLGGELNDRANQLADHLRSLGVGPEVRVGLCLERSLGRWWSGCSRS